MTYSVSIDIGGTTFSFVIFNNKKVFYKSECYDILKYSHFSDFIRKLSELILEHVQDIEKIGVACPGPLDIETCEIFNTPNLKILQYVNIREELQKYINCKNIYIENDANAYALGSYYRLENKKITDVMVGITLGTGIGLGIIINGKLFRGSYGMAGEYEFAPISENLRWANLIGFRFFKQKTKEIFGETLTPLKLYELAENNTEKAINLWKIYGKNIGLYLSHVIGLLNPNYISIGGGISKANKFFHNSIIDTLKEKCITYQHEKINISYDKNEIPNIFLCWN
tara:strand:+ start:3086 stop:3937 length:852 start_codon:yes stop_codon:yes gene_type:complete